MNRNFLLVVCLSLVASSAYAQSDQGKQGLDLSSDTPPPPPQRNDSVIIPAPTPPASPQAAPPQDATAVPTGDGRDETGSLIADDRVKSVQKKLYLKRGRFEVAPSFFVNFNDSFFTHLGASLRLAFYPADTLALALRLAYVANYLNDDVRIARTNFNAAVYYSEPIAYGMVDLEWSLFYGKIAVYNSIRHFDGYILVGVGGVWSKTSGSAEISVSGLKPGFDLGVGLRFIVVDWAAVNVAIINTTYLDVPTGTSYSIVQNITAFNIGFSFFFPLRSTYREVE